MLLGKVVGHLVATEKNKSLVGQKLLLVEPHRVEPKERASLVSTQRTVVAVDTVGAGQGQWVLIVQGSSARYTKETESLPVDAAIVGIVDRLQVDQINFQPNGTNHG